MSDRSSRGGREAASSADSERCQPKTPPSTGRLLASSCCSWGSSSSRPP